MNPDQLNILFGLLFSGLLFFVYYLGVFKYLIGSFKRALVLYKLALYPRGNFYLICRQFKAIPEITGQIWENKTGLLNALVRFTFSFCFLFTRFLSSSPFIFLIVNLTILYSILVCNKFPMLYFVWFIMELITEWLALHYVKVYSEELFVLFIGGMSTFYFFEEETIRSFFKKKYK